ncbi:MAG TPA: hypothetical protein ENI23_06645 [bacterium]|nr:hypothetical protein [bacterium]
MINKIRSTLETEKKDTPARITQYIRAALALYVVFIGTVKTCNYAEEYDTGIVSKETAHYIIKTLNQEKL